MKHQRVNLLMFKNIKSIQIIQYKWYFKKEFPIFKVEDLILYKSIFLDLTDGTHPTLNVPNFI